MTLLRQPLGAAFMALLFGQLAVGALRLVPRLAFGFPIQVICSGVLALIVLIIGIVVFAQARSNGSGGGSTAPQ